MTWAKAAVAVFALLLAAASAVLMANPDNVRPVGKSHQLFSQKRRRWNRDPVVRNFVLTTKVNHDFRQLVRDYARGTGKKINVQSFVIGHWKSQPYGKGMAKRKTIFVEPYWRGPEDAPIAMREHVVNSDRGAS